MRLHHHNSQARLIRWIIFDRMVLLLPPHHSSMTVISIFVSLATSIQTSTNMLSASLVLGAPNR